MIQQLTERAENLHREGLAVHQSLKETRHFIDQFAEAAEQINKFVFAGHLRNVISITDRMEQVMGQTQKVVDGLVTYANQQSREISDLKSQLKTAKDNSLDSQDTASLKEGQDFLDSINTTSGEVTTPTATPTNGTPPPAVDANGNPVPPTIS